MSAYYMVDAQVLLLLGGIEGGFFTLGSHLCSFLLPLNPLPLVEFFYLCVFPLSA